MKKLLIWLCALMLFISPACAVPLSAEDAMAIVDSYLTEVYSYTAEEAETFAATVVWEEDHWRINFASESHPEWIYTGTYTDHAARAENVETPFWNQNGYAYYPGEGSVREGLNRAKKNNWFGAWDLSAQNALQQYMAEWGITATARLTEGLSLGTISASDALYEYFLSCYGDETGWTVELRQWYEAEADALGLSPGKAEAIDLTPGIKTYESTADNGQKVDVVRFMGEIPESMQTVFSHPKLAGWTCLCGTTTRYLSNQYGFGLAVFEKGEERLLVGLYHPAEDVGWIISPISDTALYPDRPIAIEPDLTDVRRYAIVYPGTKTERFDIVLSERDGGRIEAFINSYTRMDESTGNGFALSLGGTNAARYENHQRTLSESGAAYFPMAMSEVDIRTFPTSMETWKATQQQVVPEGYGIIGGVHLRKSTSSRSKDLGEYHRGTLVKILGTEPGDPDPWYHVQVGQTEGYMSSRYVAETVTIDNNYMLSRSLPMAKAKKEIKLKNSPALFSGTVTTIPQGTLMHVMAECDGGWLHVTVPAGEIAWQMDVNGTDGYVKADDVLMAGSKLALEWMEP